MSFDDLRAVADAVLFEGYALYPYRPSALKNRMRWQFGVVTPRTFSEGGGGEAWWQETQCLVRPDGQGATRLAGKLRFLQLAVLSDGNPGWDEGELREVDFAVAANADSSSETSVPFRLPGGARHGGRARRTFPISGEVRIAIDPFVASQPLVKVRVRVENMTAWVAAGAPRDEALRASLLGTHLIFEVEGGTFISLVAPPEWATAAASSCRSVRTYPALAGPAARSDLLMSTPVILPDHAAVAPESPGDLFDATEIDEILTLRTLTLTEEEKTEARASDPRVAALLDRVERLGSEQMARLHGAVRSMGPASSEPASVDVAGVAIGPGNRVRLRPGPRRTDAQDMFLEGQIGVVEAVMRDTEDRVCLAVTVECDPAAELLKWHGRFLYFYPDEIEPLPAGLQEGST